MKTFLTKRLFVTLLSLFAAIWMFAQGTIHPTLPIGETIQPGTYSYTPEEDMIIKISNAWDISVIKDDQAFIYAYEKNGNYYYPMAAGSQYSLEIREGDEIAAERMDITPLQSGDIVRMEPGQAFYCYSIAFDSETEYFKYIYTDGSMDCKFRTPDGDYLQYKDDFYERPDGNTCNTIFIFAYNDYYSHYTSKFKVITGKYQPGDKMDMPMELDFDVWAPTYTNDQPKFFKVTNTESVDKMLSVKIKSGGVSIYKLVDNNYIHCGNTVATIAQGESLIIRAHTWTGNYEGTEIKASLSELYDGATPQNALPITLGEEYKVDQETYFKYTFEEDNKALYFGGNEYYLYHDYGSGVYQAIWSEVGSSVTIQVNAGQSIKTDLKDVVSDLDWLYDDEEGFQLMPGENYYFFPVMAGHYTLSASANGMTAYKQTDCGNGHALIEEIELQKLYKDSSDPTKVTGYLFDINDWQDIVLKINAEEGEYFYAQHTDFMPGENINDPIDMAMNEEYTVDDKTYFRINTEWEDKRINLNLNGVTAKYELNGIKVLSPSFLALGWSTYIIEVTPTEGDIHTIKAEYGELQAGDTREMAIEIPAFEEGQSERTVELVPGKTWYKFTTSKYGKLRLSPSPYNGFYIAYDWGYSHPGTYEVVNGLQIYNVEEGKEYLFEMYPNAEQLAQGTFTLSQPEMLPGELRDDPIELAIDEPYTLDPGRRYYFVVTNPYDKDMLVQGSRSDNGYIFEPFVLGAHDSYIFDVWSNIYEENATVSVSLHQLEVGDTFESPIDMELDMSYDVEKRTFYRVTNDSDVEVILNIKTSNGYDTMILSEYGYEIGNNSCAVVPGQSVIVRTDYGNSKYTVNATFAEPKAGESRSTAYALNEENEVNPEDYYKNVWYKYEATNDGVISISTDNYFQPIKVYVNDNTRNSREDWTNSFNFDVVEGNTYYFTFRVNDPNMTFNYSFTEKTYDLVLTDDEPTLVEGWYENNKILYKREAANVSTFGSYYIPFRVAISQMSNVKNVYIPFLMFYNKNTEKLRIIFNKMNSYDEVEEYQPFIVETANTEKDVKMTNCWGQDIYPDNQPYTREIGVYNYSEGSVIFQNNDIRTYFSGTFCEMPYSDMPEGSYTFNADASFGPATGEGTLKPFRAYLWKQSNNYNVKAIEAVLQDENGQTTAILTVKEDGSLVPTKGIYTLDGRQVGSTNKGGIYIINGNKRMVK